jgi:2,4-dienoyl-CoA reductase-like NADH-dependent reductase (Old Yellow Enzyme family)/thioredoxin reductase
LNSHNILGTPLQLGNKSIKNRIVMPAMGTGLASAQGEVTPAQLRYYEERARGGAGAIIVEIACVDSPEGRASLTQLCIDRLEMLPGLAELAETIQSYNCLALVQLHHAGRQTAPVVTGLQPVAPSPKACRFMRAEPRQLSREEIGSIRKRFVKSAVIAERAGFDGVELHAAHGYLLSQFISPYTNLRDDEYGGSLENRLRLLKEIMEGIKTRASDLILGVRFNFSDFVPGGLDLEEGLQIAQLIEQYGADLLNASCGIYESGQTSIETSSFQEGWRMEMIKQVKSRVSIPVVGGGVIRQPEMAAQLIADGDIDLVWIGRGMLADPDWANQAIKGHSEKIRPCITCNTCFETINNGRHIRCAVNPKTGREERLLRPVAALNNTVLVAGAGPAGLQAALSFANLGSRVVLAEAREQLGGQMLIAQKPPGKSPIARLQQYLIDEVNDSSVEVRLNTTLNKKLLTEVKPDVLVVATGSEPIIPDCPGIKVFYSAAEILASEVKWQNQRIIIVGGGSTGCEVADLLSEDNQVTVVERRKVIAADMENMSRLEMLALLKHREVKLCKMTILESADNKTATLRHLDTNETSLASYDQVVWAVGNRSVVPDLDPEILPDQVFVIGDAKQARGFSQALYEAQMLPYRLL